MTWRERTSGRTQGDTRERQRRSFERTAKQYDRYRPGYPSVLFKKLHSYCGLAPTDCILEIGCGTGQATTSIARWGHPVLALEPAGAMAETARRNLSAFEHVRVLETGFEEWKPEGEEFGLVLCAQAFHWLDPTTRYELIASYLRPAGTFALLWNTQVTPENDRAFFERVQEVYELHAPAIAHKGPFRTEPGDEQRGAIDATGLFADIEVHHEPWTWVLERDDYLGLLSTHSPHAALDPDVRARLLEGVGELIDAEFGGQVTEHYVAELYLARRP